MMFLLILLCVIAGPVFLVALAMKSKLIAVVAFLIGAVSVISFSWTSFSDFVLNLKARLAAPDLEKKLQRLWQESGVKANARFWVYPSPEPEFKVWVRSFGKLEVFFSQGILEIATDSGLSAAFESLRDTRSSILKTQNRRYALAHRLSRIKGPETDFRYWFLSFWLYPLERLLKIAKI